MTHRNAHSFPNIEKTWVNISNSLATKYKRIQEIKSMGILHSNWLVLFINGWKKRMNNSFVYYHNASSSEPDTWVQEYLDPKMNNSTNSLSAAFTFFFLHSCWHWFRSVLGIELKKWSELSKWRDGILVNDTKIYIILALPGIDTLFCSVSGNDNWKLNDREFQ